jgi:tetratricopeptide (TPR) repeat protein
MAAISTACRTCWVVLLCVAALGARAAERAAEVVSVQGQGESRPDDKVAWRPAAPRQELFPSNYVRTGAYSRMGLLFQDRTQVRLAEKTLMQIKASATAPGERTVLRLEQGRSWSQTNAAPANLYLETPSATAAIRGTDWDIEVFEGGRSLLTVFSGEVDFFNDFGRVTVAKNESAQAIPGQAPTKIIIANPRDRVQWVTAYAVNPLRHIDASAASPALREVLDMIRRGETAQAAARISSASMPDDPELVQLARIALLVRSERFEEAFNATTGALAAARQPAPYLIASDLMVYEGKIDRANAFALEGLVRFRDDPRLVAQLARVSLAAGDFDAAQRRLASAMSAPKPAFEVRLAAADTARAQGEGRAARAGYEAARAERPADDRPWLGIGVVDSEREAVASARTHLNAALERNPGGPGYQGELGTLETFADRFEDAEAALGAALKANPADYVALTGAGLLELKRGHPEAALENFLRASVLEPRYARAHVYAAVANYQLRRHEIALRELAKASELDDKDPLPYLFASMIQTDLFRAADAVASSRKAIERLPYLKSLNQVANDQQGGANLGRSLAFFGLEEWAQNRAQESYYPYWAGSHLFLSDRYPGQFNKNSELLQGFMTDPTVFGASNRFQSLVQTPGNYANAIAGYDYSREVKAWLGDVRANGLFDAGMPVAYFVDYDSRHFRSIGDQRGPDDGRIYTGALGIRPVHELGLFVYGFDEVSDSDTKRLEVSPRFALTHHQKTATLNGGVHYRLAPTSQFWLRATAFRTQDEAAGAIQPDPSQPVTSILSKLVSRQPEYAFRHTFDAGNHQVTWGLETSHKQMRNDFTIGEDVLNGALSHYQFNERSRTAFLSDAANLAPALLVQADAWWHDNRRILSETTFFLVDGQVYGPLLIDEDRSRQRLAPRFGMRLKMDGGAMFRAAYQDWFRPVGLSTIGPVATAGIPMDDRLVTRGGRQQRARAQWELEADARTFWTAFYDYKRIDNLKFSVTPFNVSDDDQLTKLRSFDYGRLQRDLYEFISAPDFDAGAIRIAGAAVNRIVSESFSVNARYQYTTSRNTGPSYADRQIPYLPRHAGEIGATWVTPQRVFFTTRAVYRTERFTDQANLQPIRRGFDAAADIFWETRDKRLRVHAGIDNAFHPTLPTQYFASLVLLF